MTPPRQHNRLMSFPRPSGTASAIPLSMNAIKSVQARINNTPVTEQATIRALYTELSRLYADALRATR